MTCFNVDPVFAESFKFAKSKGAGDFTIKYMFATFDKHATSGEFFLEFDEKVWDHKLEQCFEAQGAGQVNIMTFENNDGNESASNALLRLHTKADGVTYERGTCQPALHAKLQAKLAEMDSKKADSKELDDKTQLAIKHSLADISEKLTSNQNVTDQIGAKVGEVQTGVCEIIPNYLKEIEDLKTKLAHKTKECDRIEGQKAHLTRNINSKDARIDLLEAQVKIFQTQAAVWAKERAAFLETEADNKEERRILLRQLDVHQTIDQAAKILDDYQQQAGRKRRHEAPAGGLTAGPSWD